MTESVTYDVLVNGEFRVGFDPERVSIAFAELFKITPEKATEIVGARRVLKKGVNLKVAESYKQKLGSIGLDVTLKKNAALVPETEKPMVLALEPVQEEKSNAGKSSDAAMSTAFSCPKCGLEQTRSEQCTGCGVYFHKVPKKELAPEGAITASSDQAQVEHDDNESVSESGQLIMYLVPLLVAVFGAFLWKLIAVAFDYELGLIAWVIGGAIGFSAAMTCAKGQTTGMICAALVLFSILGGKYMAYASFQADAVQAIETATEYEGIDLIQLYEEEKNDAEKYADTVTDDSSLRQFMVDYGYSESQQENDVSDEEIANFNEYNLPRLQEMALTHPDFKEWKRVSIAGEIEGYSTLDLMVESLGLLDLVFMFLGVATAFRLGSGEEVS